MSKRTVTTSVIVAALVFGGPFARAEEAVNEPIYRFDPALSLETPQQPEISTGPQVIVDKDDKAASIRLQSATPLFPYLGVESSPALSPEEIRLLPDFKEGGALSDYKLEAGVGVFVEDKASLNLGYRFRDQPSLLGDRRNDPLTLTGDLRVSFDLKVPFD